MIKMLSAGTLGKKGGWAYIRGWAYYRASTVHVQDKRIILALRLLVPESFFITYLISYCSLEETLTSIINCTFYCL